MSPEFEQRIAYGRAIRDRALCLLDAHGSRAETEALTAAREPGTSEADRLFWEATAARIARQLRGAPKLAESHTAPG